MGRCVYLALGGSLTLSLLLGACAGSGLQPALDTAPGLSAPDAAGEVAAERHLALLPASLNDSLSGLASPQETLAQLSRSGSIDKAGSCRLGAEMCPQLPCNNVSLNGANASFTPDRAAPAGPLAGLALASYAFLLDGYDGISGASLQVAWEAPLNQASLYIGLANFSSGRWDWFTPENYQHLNFGPLPDYLGPQQQFLLVIALQGSGSASLRQLQVAANNLPTAVLCIRENDEPGVGGFSKLLDASASDAGGDPGDAIANYCWDLDGDGEYEVLGREATIAYPYIQPGIHHPAVTVIDKAGNTDTVVLDYAVGGLPLAQLSANMLDPAVGEAVLLDASASTDPAGGALHYEWDGDGDGDFEAESAANPYYEMSCPLAGEQVMRVRVRNSAGIEAVAEVQLSVQPSPQASFVCSPEVATLGSSVLLDASGSTAWHGQVVQYEWDLEGDGIFELNLGGGSVLSKTFNSSGYHRIGLRVTNANGATATVEHELAVELGGGRVLDNAAFSRDSSLALVDGRPAIAYYDSAAQELCYVQADDAQGRQWGKAIVLDSLGDSGRSPSLQVVNGRPAVAYFRADSSDLMFVRALDSDGNLWPAAQLLDSFGGCDPCLSVINGSAAISYCAGSLSFIRALDANCMLWSPPLHPDIQDQSGYCSSLSVVNGKPAISFYDAAHADLRYVRALDALGGNWALPQTLDSAGDCGADSQLLLVGGVPAISYYASDSQELRYLSASDANGSAWGAPGLAASGCAGLGHSLALLDGVPAISYFSNSGAGDLCLVSATDSAASSWKAPLLVDSRGQRGSYSAMLQLSEQAAIAYSDIDSGSLCFVGFKP